MQSANCNRDRSIGAEERAHCREKHTQPRIEIANPSVTVPPSWLPRLSPGRRRRRHCRQRRGTSCRRAWSVWALERICSRDPIRFLRRRRRNTLSSRQTSSCRTIRIQSTTTRPRARAAPGNKDETAKVRTNSFDALSLLLYQLRPFLDRDTERLFTFSRFTLRIADWLTVLQGFTAVCL